MWELPQNRAFAVFLSIFFSFDIPCIQRWQITACRSIHTQRKSSLKHALLDTGAFWYLFPKRPCQLDCLLRWHTKASQGPTTRMLSAFSSTFCILWGLLTSFPRTSTALPKVRSLRNQEQQQWTRCWYKVNSNQQRLLLNQVAHLRLSTMAAVPLVTDEKLSNEIKRECWKSEGKKGFYKKGLLGESSQACRKKKIKW